MRRPATTLAALAALALLMFPGPSAAQTGGLLGEAEEIVVIDPGAEPRQLLRYDWTVGDTEVVEATMWMRMDIDAAGETMVMELPMSFEFEETVAAVLPDGTTRFELLFTSWEIDVGGVTFDEQDLTEELEQELAGETSEMTRGLVGITGWEVYDDRGAQLDQGIDMPEAMPPDLADSFEQVGTSGVRFPEEPVGVGARWVAESTFSDSGFDMDVTATTEVIEIEADSVVLETTLSAAVDAGPALLEGMPEGITLDEFTMSGGGRSDVDLTRLNANGDMELLVRFAMSGPFGEDGGTESMSMTMEVGVETEASHR